MKRKLELQVIAEKILDKHGIDSSKDFYLKLSLPPYLDLVMERGDYIIIIGHYRKENGDLIGDPVLVFDYNQGNWYPRGIEQWCGDTVCSYVEDGKRIVHPEKIKEFRSLQLLFAKNLKEQGWLEHGSRVQCGLVCEIMFIGKDEPNPMRDISEYANPNEM